MKDNTLEYYNKNVARFTEGTVNVVFTDTQEKFLNKLPEQAAILDFGCGAGRDTKYFLSKGYAVTATDGSEELCKYASAFTGIEVKKLLFNDLEDKEVYDGIWACSSILHLGIADLKDVMFRMADALKENGVIYTSFKYGEFEGERNGRCFTDMTEDKFAEFMSDVPVLKTEEQWVSGDVRPGRENEKWLNLILRKVQGER